MKQHRRRPSIERTPSEGVFRSPQPRGSIIASEVGTTVDPERRRCRAWIGRIIAATARSGVCGTKQGGRVVDTKRRERCVSLPPVVPVFVLSDCFASENTRPDRPTNNNPGDGNHRRGLHPLSAAGCDVTHKVIHGSTIPPSSPLRKWLRTHDSEFDYSVRNPDHQGLSANLPMRMARIGIWPCGPSERPNEG